MNKGEIVPRAPQDRLARLAPVAGGVLYACALGTPRPLLTPLNVVGVMLGVLAQLGDQVMAWMEDNIAAEDPNSQLIIEVGRFTFTGTFRGWDDWTDIAGIISSDEMFAILTMATKVLVNLNTRVGGFEFTPYPDHANDQWIHFDLSLAGPRSRTDL